MNNNNNNINEQQNDINIVDNYDINGMSYSSYNLNSNDTLNQFGNLSKFIYYNEQNKCFIITIKLNNTLITSDILFRKNIYQLLKDQNKLYINKYIKQSKVDTINVNNNKCNKKIKLYLYKPQLAFKILNDLLLIKENFNQQNIFVHPCIFQIINHNYNKATL